MKSRLSLLKSKLANFREFFWPILEPEPKEDKSKKPQNDQITIQVDEENLEKAFELKSKIYDSEEERRKSIESKASLFLSTISITTTLVVASSALITGNEENNIAVKVSVLISFILSIYTVRTVWFSVKALERGKYQVMGVDDINVKGDKTEYYKHLIVCLSKKTKANQITINNKVDYLVMAQEYYKRAIVIICIYACLIVLFCLFFKNEPKNNNRFQPSYIHSTYKD